MTHWFDDLFDRALVERWSAELDNIRNSRFDVRDGDAAFDRVLRENKAAERTQPRAAAPTPPNQDHDIDR